MPFLRDVRFALRILTRYKSYAIAAVAVFALGIGATIAVFTVVRAVLIEPLPYRDPSQLVIMRADGPGITHQPALTPQEFLALRDRTDLFEDLGTVNDSHANITGVDDMEPVPAASISDNFLRLLGVAPAIGRQVNRRDDLGKEGFVTGVNVSYELWQRRWHGDPALVGTQIEINNLGVVVVGIMPRGFRTYLGGANVAERIDIWFPGAPDYPRGSTSRTIPSIGRLRPGMTRGAAQSAVDTFMTRFMVEQPASYRAGGIRLSVVSLDADVVRDVKPALLALAGAVGFVLLVACANLMNLLLARACARTRELAIRAAIGASRAELIGQLATESLVLGVIGAAAGLLVAQWGIEALLQLAPAALPRRENIGIDAQVALFAVGVSLCCSLVSGLVPAWQTTRSDVAGMMKQDPAATRGASMTRGLLVASQLALSLMLLVGAGLMMRAFIGMRHVSLGFESAHVLAMQFDVQLRVFDTPEKLMAFDRAVLDAVSQVPGVQRAGVGLPIPLEGTLGSQRYATGPDASEQRAAALIALPGFFESLGVPLLAGRYFEWADAARTQTQSPIVIDQTLAELCWPQQSALGRRLLLDPFSKAPRWAEVVGVVAHVQTESLRAPRAPQIWTLKAYREMGLVVRTGGDPRVIAPTIKNAIEQLRPGRPVRAIRPLDEYVSDASADTRFALFVLGTFAVMAVLLTAIGVYGVVAYATARRTREIALRLALGAGSRRIVGLVLREAATWTAGGLVVGTIGARALARYVEALLYHVTPNDALTFGFVATLLSLVALVATVIPALRAVRIDPMQALRAD